MQQFVLFEPQSDWKPVPIDQLPQWNDYSRIGLDLETRDPFLQKLGGSVGRENGYIIGISFATDQGDSFYLPVKHAEGFNYDEKIWEYLKDQFHNFKGEIVGMNLSYDLNWLHYYGFQLDNVRVRDVQTAETLIYEHHWSYSLDSIAKRYGFAGKEETVLVEVAQLRRINPKSDMWKLPAKYVAAYAKDDALLPLQILEKQEIQIAEQSLQEVFDLESKIGPILVKMTRRGVLIDTTKLDYIEEWTFTEEKKHLDEILKKTGFSVNADDLNKSSALAKMMDKVGVPYAQTKDGNPSITADLLRSHLKVPGIVDLAKAKKINHLRNSFVNSVRNHVVNGRLHCGFNQLMREKDTGGRVGAAYGRLSSTHPNIQQQPARDEFAKMWRSIYIPDGPLWACLDYSQQEPRILTHFAARLNLTKADKAAKKYRNNPATDYHQMMADMTGLKRKVAKTLLLGICYGMGGAKLCDSLNLPKEWGVYYKGMKYFENYDKALNFAADNGGKMFESAGKEGRKVKKKFNDNLPYVKELADKCSAIAESRGWIKTLSGRRCRFPQGENGKYRWAFKAINRLIQGSAADQTKAAMVAVDAAGYNIQLQIHDELDLSVENKKEAREIADIMENCVKLEVPSLVDVEIGPNWGEIE